MFAGREVARALGKMQITADHCSADTSDFTEKEEKTLQEWVDKFDQKYEVVGKVWWSLWGPSSTLEFGGSLIRPGIINRRGAVSVRRASCMARQGSRAVHPRFVPWPDGRQGH